MSQNVTFNGQVYVIPDLADNNWGQNVTDYLVALPQGALQKTAGAFTLAADVDFGASFGLKSAYFKTRASNPASAGLVRLANTDTVVWRNAGNSGDLALAVNGSNQLTFNGIVLESDTLPSAYIFVGNASNESTGVPMTGDIGIDNTGLTSIQNGVIINTDINASAAIAVSKLAALTASKSVVSDGSGFLATGWGYTGGDMTTTANGALRFQDSAGGDYVGFVAPAAVTTHTYLLPIAAGLNGQVLSWTTGGQLAWINASGTGTINSGTAGRFAYYAGSGTTLSDQTALTTDGSTYVRFADGSAAIPSISFNNDPDTGVYSYGTNYLGLATAGVASWAIGPTGQLLGLISTSAIHVCDGAVGTPSLTFRNDTNTGLYSSAADEISISTGGVQVGLFKSAGANFRDGTVSLPGISFISDPDTGIYSPFANGIGFASAGVLEASVSSGSFNVINYLKLPAGTAAAPSLHFTADTDTGIYLRSGGSGIGFAFGGTLISTLSGSGLAMNNGTMYLTDGSAASPSLSFGNDLDTGIYNTGGNVLRFSTGGVQTMTMSSPGVYFDAGAAATPSISFFADSDTGLFWHGTNWLGITCGGVQQCYMGGGWLYWADGAAATPAYSFMNDVDTGMYRGTTNVLAFAAGGNQIMNIAPTYVQFLQPIFSSAGTAANPSISFQSDTNTGIYLQATDSIGITTGAIKTAVFGPTSTSAGNTWSPMTLYVGAFAQAWNFEGKSTTVSTGATTILASVGSGILAMVWGYSGTPGTQFMDLVMYTYYNSTPLVIATRNDGSPASRTYTSSLGNLNLAMASGTYTVATKAFSQG